MLGRRPLDDSDPRILRARKRVEAARERERGAARELRDRIAFAIGNGSHVGGPGRRAAERSYRRIRARRGRYEARLERLLARRPTGTQPGARATSADRTPRAEGSV